MKIKYMCMILSFYRKEHEDALISLYYPIIVKTKHDDTEKA